MEWRTVKWLNYLIVKWLLRGERRPVIQDEELAPLIWLNLGRLRLVMTAVALCCGSEPPPLPLERQGNICVPPPPTGGSAQLVEPRHIPQTRRGWAPGEDEGEGL